jgi:hypothetical protein
MVLSLMRMTGRETPERSRLSEVKCSDDDVETKMIRGEAATTELLRLVCTEIARDGGACLVTSLKDYIPVSNKRLNSLLYHSIGKAKLLSFLERHEQAVSVDRTQTPHWAQILPNGLQLHVDHDSLHAQNTKAIEALRDQVLSKACYVLQKRHSKLSRRQKHNSRSEYDTYAVNTAWLLVQCTRDYHEYLRMSGTYHSKIYSENGASEVQPPGSRLWQDLVLQEFESLLESDNQSRFVSENNKAWLKRPTIEPSVVDDEYLQTLVETLRNLVEQDGGHEVRLELLLHRHKQLKNVLGGRDLRSIIEEYPKQFENFSIRYDGPDIVFETKDLKQGRLLVDDVGLYSVANSRWGSAMAKMMVQSSRILGWDKDVIAVDLTASVGGMTLGLAKTDFFKEIIAVEIDPDRARLCADNMKMHKVSDAVRIENDDCMNIIPLLPKHACISLDPPWGGVGYKQKQNKEPLGNMVMGPWTFLQVLSNVYKHCKPCLVGMRLPVVHIKHVDDLLDDLRKEGVAFETMTIKHMSVQRFVVLHFQNSGSNVI